MSNQLTVLSVEEIIKKLNNIKTLDVRFNKLAQEEKEKIKESKPEDLQLFC